MATKRIKDCFDKQVAARRISRKQAQIAVDEAQRLYNDYATQMNPAAAEVMAVQQAVANMQANVQRLKNSANMQIITQAKAVNDAVTHRRGGVFGAAAVLSPDPSGDAAYPSVEGIAGAVRERLTAVIGTVVNDFKSTWLGFRQDVKGSVDIVYELFGEKTGNAKAREFAAGFTKANKYGVERMQRGGAIVDYLESWRLGQRAAPDALKKAGKEDYVSSMKAWHDDGRFTLIDYELQKPLSRGDARVVPMLAKMYDNQSQFIMPSGATGSGFGKLNERRVIHWNTADGWLEHNRKYGYGDAGIYDALMGHLDGLANDVAIVERLGPNPQSTINALYKVAVEAKEGGDETLLFRVSPKNFLGTWAVLNGSVNGVDNQNVSAIAGGVRNLLTGSKMGGGTVTAVPTDSMFMMFGAHMNGIGSVRMLKGMLESLTSADKRAFMKRMEVHASDLQGSLLEMSRYGDELASASKFERGTALAASAVIRASGLAAWTNTMKRTFMMEFTGFIADNVGKAFDKIDPALNELLTKKGVTPEQWDVIRQAPLLDYKGAKWFDFKAVSDHQLGERMAEIMMEQRRQTIIETSAGERSITTGQTRRGTVWGETARSLSLFKSFTLTMMSMQMYNMFRASSIKTRLEYAGFMLLALPVAGMAALQAKQMLAGKDPLDMTDPRVWAQATLQGGGMGIIGDFLGAVVSPRTGGTVVTAMQGPVVGLGNDLIRLVSSGYREMADGEKVKLASEAVRFIKSNLPGSNLWYARLALERAVWDQLQVAVDPEAHKSFMRMENNAMKNTGQSFWSRPGEGVPQRLPDLGAAIGGNR